MELLPMYFLNKVATSKKEISEKTKNQLTLIFNEIFNQPKYIEQFAHTDIELLKEIKKKVNHAELADKIESVIQEIYAKIPIETVPEEILANVGKFLSTEDLIKARLVYQRMRESMTDSENISKILDNLLNTHQCDSKKKLFDFFEKYGQLVTSLNLSRRSKVGASPAITLTDEDIEKLVRICPNLKELNLFHSRITDKGVAHLRNLKSLQMLDLSGCREVLSTGFPYLITLKDLRIAFLWYPKLEHLNALTNLRNLDISMVENTELELEHLKGLINLRSLNLFNSKLTSEGLKPLKALTNLESLYLRFSKIKDAELEHLKDLPYLKFLDLRDAANITGSGLRNLQSLETLLLQNCNNIKLEFLQDLTNLKSLYLNEISPDEDLDHLKNLKNLTHLYLEFDEAIEGERLTFLSQFSQLRYLALYNCKCIDNTMLSCFEHFINLEKLELTSCKISDQGLQHIAKIPHLKILDLYCSDLKEEGFKNTEFKSLISLDLSRTNIESSVLESIGSIISLQSLNLFSCNKIKPEDIKHLQNLEALRTLNLSYTEIDQHSLEYLSSLPNLETIDLCGCNKVVNTEVLKHVPHVIIKDF